MEDRITPGLYLEMTDRAIDEYARDRVPDVLAHPGRSARHVVAQREAQPRRSAARPARVRPPRRLRGRRHVRRARHTRRHHRPSFPPLPPTRPGHRLRPSDHRTLARADLAEGGVEGTRAARLGRLRAHPSHRRGRGPRLLHDHAVRERRRRRSPLHAFLRDGHRRSGDRVQIDDSARDATHRRRAHRCVQAVGVGAEPAHHVRQLVRSRRRKRLPHERRLLRGRHAPTRVPVVLDRGGRRRRDRARARCGDLRAERGEQAALGVRRGARRRDARRDRRSLPARMGSARARVLGRSTDARDARRRRSGRHRRRRQRAGEHRRLRRRAARAGGDNPVVDLPGGPEPVARRDGARARQRAHDHNHRLPQRDASASRSAGNRLADRAGADWSSGAAARAAGAHPSPNTRTGSATAGPGE